MTGRTWSLLAALQRVGRTPRQARRLGPSNEDHPTIDHDRLACDVVRVGRGQEGRETRDIPRHRVASEEDARAEVIDGLIRLFGDALLEEFAIELVPERRMDDARPEAIDRDSVLSEGAG